MPRLQVQPRGLFPDISFGREPSNSTGGTFTHVAAGFPGAHLNPDFLDFITLLEKKSVEYLVARI
jgi:hypothetical protein